MRLTLHEMQEDILHRLYDSTIQLLESGDLSEEEKNRLLHETANVFGFSCEKVCES